MELQLIMDGGPETLNGTMWFSNTSSPTYEQLSPARSSRCDVVTGPQQTTMGYHSPQNPLWQEKHNSPKGSPIAGDRTHLNGGSPQQLSPVGSSPSCEQSNLKRRSVEPLQHIAELEKKHVRRDGSIGSNGSGQGWSTQVEELAEHLAADFDGSLSALAASDLATAVASYNMSFQYVLAAATSIATKVNEETLTYLNQGQSYEIKLKKLGDLSAYRGKILKGHPGFLFQSTIRICFHERRLQYTEREQMLAWQRARPGERLLEVDVPLSYGMVDVCQPSPSNNSVEFMWDPTKEVGVYIKVNCISTEFTPKKHGGEKGVPFRIQVETRLPGGPRLHAASCQVKVFKLKGADRKHKQDRDKILRRPLHEQGKYQASYECTVLSDIPLESLSASSLATQNGGSPYAPTDAISPQTRATIGMVPLVPASDAMKENTSTAPALPSPAAILPDQPCIEAEVGLATRKATSPQQILESMKTSTPCLTELPPDANAKQTTAWLRASRFNAFESTFASFSASDILRLSREDLIQICGVADGIRLFNTLHSKAPTPKLTLYFSLEGNGSLWRVAYLETLTSGILTNKLLSTLSLPPDRLHSILFLGPQGIHVLVTDELVANMKDESMYLVEMIKDPASERYKLLIKSKAI
ncbi:transcription factor CP2-like protein 1 isoform X3 [Odontomachus brunneus]|uniref:transcription factor CP2-like protein 1 isoform X3 n=1 Tax=Odontomachus brunneus TaxID=486640 RepID=UPI0013F20D9D|nr:transcription factor CP2-like protein 1 isoform X3 [Odontomachus brunneus]